MDTVRESERERLSLEVGNCPNCLIILWRELREGVDYKGINH